jgi:hypothetical protein
MPERESSLRCPECDTKVSWNGTQFVCRNCPWTEHKEKPPSDRKIEVPKELRDPEQKGST